MLFICCWFLIYFPKWLRMRPTLILSPLDPPCPVSHPISLPTLFHHPRYFTTHAHPIQAEGRVAQMEASIATKLKRFEKVEDKYHKQCAASLKAESARIRAGSFFIG